MQIYVFLLLKYIAHKLVNKALIICQQYIINKKLIYMLSK